MAISLQYISAIKSMIVLNCTALDKTKILGILDETLFCCILYNMSVTKH